MNKFIVFLGLLAFVAMVSCDDQMVDEMKQEKIEQKEEMSEEELEYRKGSLCGYCSYCKFCKLCDQDCPCEKGPTKPNCHMCKYCKFCYLCSGVCDTICQPGGIIDKVTGAIMSSLPSVNNEEVDSDIESVKDWIDNTKDEL